MIDLCVTSYNTKDLMERFITTLYKDGPSDLWKLYVTDNGSVDGSAQYLEQVATETDYIDTLLLNDNIGYSAACNQMAAEGKGDIICLLNADVWFESSELSRVIKFFDMYPDAGIMGPKQRDEEGFIRHAGIIGTNTHPQHRGWRQHDPKDALYRDILECVTVSGSAYFVRRSVWNELWDCPIYNQVSPTISGAFLPTPHYYEETWCSYHARAHGWKVYYCGLISIGHSWHAASPVGGHADNHFPISRSIFRAACDVHGIAHD